MKTEKLIDALIQNRCTHPVVIYWNHRLSAFRKCFQYLTFVQRSFEVILNKISSDSRSGGRKNEQLHKSLKLMKIFSLKTL